MKRRMQRAAFAAAMAAAMGFGGAQAFASPAAPSADEARACSAGQCSRDCRRAGADGGFCDQGGCICIFPVSAGA